jgi:hypothetical protein
MGEHSTARREIDENATPPTASLYEPRAAWREVEIDGRYHAPTRVRRA